MLACGKGEFPEAVTNNGVSATVPVLPPFEANVTTVDFTWDSPQSITVTFSGVTQMSEYTVTLNSGLDGKAMELYGFYIGGFTVAPLLNETFASEKTNFINILRIADNAMITIRVNVLKKVIPVLPEFSSGGWYYFTPDKRIITIPTKGTQYDGKEYDYDYQVCGLGAQVISKSINSITVQFVGDVCHNGYIVLRRLIDDTYCVYSYGSSGFGGNDRAIYPDADDGMDFIMQLPWVVSLSQIEVLEKPENDLVIEASENSYPNFEVYFSNPRDPYCLKNGDLGPYSYVTIRNKLNGESVTHLYW